MTPGDGDTGAARRRARRGEGERLREDVLDAAEALLIEHGNPDAVSMRAVADRVGVSPPAIYLHFADKVELFFACCSRRFAELDEHMAIAAAGTATVIDRLEAMARAYIRFGLERGEQYRVMLVGPVPDAVKRSGVEGLPGARALEVTAAAVEEGITAGELRRDLDPPSTALTLWAVCHGTVMVLLSMRGIAGPEPLPPEEHVVDQTVALIRTGLLA